MKKIIVFALAIIAGVCLAKTVKAQDANSSLLWKVSGNGLEKPSYVYGTIHLICPDDFSMPTEIKDAFAATDITVMELDMDDPQLQSKMQTNLMNEGLANFSSQLKEEDLTLLDNYFTKNFNAGMAQLGIMKPFALYSMLITTAMDCGTPASYEGSFTEMSGKAEKEIVGLETVKFQVGVFDQIPAEEQIEWIVGLVKDTDVLKQQMADLVTAYKTKSADKLYEVVVQAPEFQDYVDVLLDQRNKNWIPKIEEIIKKQPAFIAVGAGHLASENGVIELLKAQGYEVTPIQY